MSKVSDQVLIAIITFIGGGAITGYFTNKGKQVDTQPVAMHEYIEMGKQVKALLDDRAKLQEELLNVQAQQRETNAMLVDAQKQRDLQREQIAKLTKEIEQLHAIIAEKGIDYGKNT